MKSFITKGEKREQKRRKQNSHPVHGKSLEAIINSIRKRGKQK